MQLLITFPRPAERLFLKFSVKSLLESLFLRTFAAWEQLSLVLTMKTRGEYINILKSHADELQTQFGITSMRLFGSVARDEHHEGSDVDLFVVMPAKAYTLCAAASYLESILGTSVDLIRKHSNMRPFFLNQINIYGIDIFGQA